MTRFFSFLLFFLFLIFVSRFSQANESETKKDEIQRFVDHAEICIHLSGELSGDNGEDQKKIIAMVNQECALAKEVFINLDEKYKNDDQVKSVFDKYKDVIYN